MVKTEQDLYARLDELGLEYSTVEHAAVFTVEESRAHRHGLAGGGHTKNLFLRDKKNNLWLLTIEENCPINLKQLRHVLGASGGLSFGNADMLMQVLGVMPGSVIAFSVINDREKRVTMVLDTALMETEIVNAHPLRNDRTTAITPAALLTFLKAEGHDPLMIDFKALADELTTQEAVAVDI